MKSAEEFTSFKALQQWAVPLLSGPQGDPLGFLWQRRKDRGSTSKNADYRKRKKIRGFLLEILGLTAFVSKESSVFEL